MPEPSQPNQVLDAELKAWAEGGGDDRANSSSRPGFPSEP